MITHTHSAQRRRSRKPAASARWAIYHVHDESMFVLAGLCSRSERTSAKVRQNTHDGVCAAVCRTAPAAAPAAATPAAASHSARQRQRAVAKTAHARAHAGMRGALRPCACPKSNSVVELIKLIYSIARTYRASRGASQQLWTDSRR